MKREFAEAGLSSTESELASFSQALLKGFEEALPRARERLSGGELYSWAKEGVSIAAEGSRCWEAAVEYFRASPQLLKYMAFPLVADWAGWGRWLCLQSPALAGAYFRASPGVWGLFAPGQFGEWAKLGSRFYQGNWRSSSLCCQFFELSPDLLSGMSLGELESLGGFIDSLCRRSYELAAQCLALAPAAFSKLESQDRRGFLALAQGLIEADWSDARAYWEVGPKALSRVDRGHRARFLSLAQRVGGFLERGVLPFLIEGSRALGQLDGALHSRILGLFEEILPVSPTAAVDFLKNCPGLLGRLTFPQLELWLAEGLQMLREGGEAGSAYFRLESSHSQEVMDHLSCGVELEKIREILRLYSKALTGRQIQILPTEKLSQKGIGWVGTEKPSTEGTTIYLPSFVDEYGHKAENFACYKVFATHQIAHLEFGSFEFCFDREAQLFPNLRPTLSRGDGGMCLTDMERFFDLFPDRRLAADIFTIVEDSRVDFRLKQEYGGIRGTYQRFQRRALERRHSPQRLPLREASIEILLRLGMGELTEVSVPGLHKGHLLSAAKILEALHSPLATVEDSAEATIRLYALLRQVPNVPPGWFAPEDWETVDLLDLSQALGVDGAEVSLIFSTDPAEEEYPYSSPEVLELRGDFKPELVQTLMKVREVGFGASGLASPIPLEALEELARKSIEIGPGEIPLSSGLFVTNLLKEAGRPQLPLVAELRPHPYIMAGEETLLAPELGGYPYDEWDFRVGDYKPRWCLVRERRVEEGSPDFFERTLEKHAGLAHQVRRQFELMKPELFKKIKKLHDGEDFELDAVVEAIVEKKAGGSPTEKIYWRRNKLERDVSVVFLLDMSASTSESIIPAPRSAEDWPVFDSPRQYLAWFRSWHAEQEAKGKNKRIIDVEKESTVLLIKALETIGDSYGLYGFSGYGRDNVEFYIIKDIDEEFSERVVRRIDKIAPLQATRMGAAIRHAITKLENRDSKTKILFLISDGRPQDQGYSRDGREKDYAIHDTKMALLEAKRKHITPFCLTVDRAGQDYMRAMCQDIGYEVVMEIESLPSRLPALYRRLTI